MSIELIAVEKIRIENSMSSILNEFMVKTVNSDVEAVWFIITLRQSVTVYLRSFPFRMNYVRD